jgi:amino acid transporter
VSRATYAAVGLIGGFYVLNTYAIVVAYGPSAVGEAAAANPGALVFAMTTQYLGTWATDIMEVLLVTSFFAVVLAFHNTLSRYMFALGRAGLLPSSLGRSHRSHQSPHIASVCQTAIAVVIVGAFALAGADPYAELFSWLVGLGTVGVLVLQATASLAVVGFFRRNKSESNPFVTVIAPLLGAAGLIAAVVLALSNFDVLTGVTTGVVPLLPWLLPVAALIGILVGTVRVRSGMALDRAFEEAAPERDAEHELVGHP